jgi:hypothetical protein
MKSFFKNELSLLAQYILKNWRSLFLSLAVGLFLFWILSVFEQSLRATVNGITTFRPDLVYFLIFEWLILIAVWSVTTPIWVRYRNSYFLKQPVFLLIDALLIVAVTIFCLCWITRKLLCWESFYFWGAGISLGVFVVFTYIFAIFPLIKKELNKYCNHKDAPLGQIKLFSDEPINDEIDDLIGRRSFANALKDHIYNLSFTESFVMALYGRWGEGKTSILNLLKKEIKKEANLLVYEFDPWYFGDNNALISNFYYGLNDLLREHYFLSKKIKNALKFYPEILFRGFALRFHKSATDDRPLEIKNDIENFIASIDKRVLVVIDDIDRLQKKQILAVFQLIKLASQIKNMVFLISFDPSKVALAIKNNGEMNDPQSYIEKIVQLPINIPMTDQSIIDKFIYYSHPGTGSRSEIDKLFDRLEIDEARIKEFDDQFGLIYQSELKQILSTYRAAKRYLNSIFFRLPPIIGEVYLYDFFIVEIFQTFFPAIYADMKNAPWYYISQWSFGFMARSPLPADDKQKYQAIREHIENLIDSNTKYKGVIVSLLGCIFPEVKKAFSGSGYGINYGEGAEDYRIKHRIAHSDCFLKYFMLGVREGVIPDAEFDTMVRLWKEASSIEDEIKKSFFEKYQKEFKLIDVLQRLKLYSESLDGQLVLPLIKTLYKNCSKFHREGDLWDTEFDQAEMLIIGLIEKNNAIDDNKIHEVLQEVVNNSERFDLASAIVLFSNEDRNSSLYRIYRNVNIDRLRDALAERLRKYFIEEERDIFDEYNQEREFGFILYQWATRWGDKSKNHRDEVTDYLIKIFNKKQNRIGFFLLVYMKNSLIRTHSMKDFDYKGFSVVYDAEKFAECLKALGETAYSTENEKEAIDLFLKAHTEASSASAPSTSK